jgi:IK cytokine
MLLDGKTREKARDVTKSTKKSSKKPHEGRGKNSSRASEDAYRDRARERRERGIDEKDTLDGPSAQDALGHERGVFERDDAATRGDGTATTEYARMKTIEESKYLGGDVERTHLVKGLDFALLNKVRSEIADTKAMEEEERVTSTAEREGDKPTFATASARAIHEFITKGSKFNARRNAYNIASGAVSYSFDLAANSRRDVPTTLHKATDDDGMAGVRALRAYVDPAKDASLLVRLGKLMHYLALGSAKAIKKFRRDERKTAEEEAKAKAEAAARASRVDAAEQAPGDTSSDEDIFADAGKDYEPTYEKKQDSKPSDTDVTASRAIFGNEASAPAPKAKQIAADDYVEEEDEDRPVNAFASFGDYDECYPGYDVDVDDTSGFNKRGDKDNADGEGASEEAAKKDALRKKRQLGNEFSKIRALVKDKFGEKNDVAFKDDSKKIKTAKQTATAPGASKGKRSDDAAGGGARKKLRL